MAAPLPRSLILEPLPRAWRWVARSGVEAELERLAALSRRRRSVCRVGAVVEAGAPRRLPRDLEA